MASEQNCLSCRYFGELKTPWARRDGATIYGYCFKSATGNASPNMGKGYAVFQPGGHCKDWKKLRNQEAGGGA